MEALFRKLFPVILQLACDVDQVTRELFEPLMMQLIHWFTSNQVFESADTMALLDSFMVSFCRISSKLQIVFRPMKISDSNLLVMMNVSK